MGDIVPLKEDPKDKVNKVLQGCFDYNKTADKPFKSFIIMGYDGTQVITWISENSTLMDLILIEKMLEIRNNDDVNAGEED